MFCFLVIAQQSSTCCEKFQISSVNIRASTEMRRLQDQNQGLLKFPQQPGDEVLVHLSTITIPPEGDRMLLRVVEVGGKHIR